MRLNKTRSNLSHEIKLLNEHNKSKCDYFKILINVKVMDRVLVKGKLRNAVHGTE